MLFWTVKAVFLQRTVCSYYAQDISHYYDNLKIQKYDKIMDPFTLYYAFSFPSFLPLSLPPPLPFLSLLVLQYFDCVDPTFGICTCLTANKLNSPSQMMVYH